MHVVNYIIIILIGVGSEKWKASPKWNDHSGFNQETLSCSMVMIRFQNILDIFAYIGLKVFVIRIYYFYSSIIIVKLIFR